MAPAPRTVAGLGSREARRSTRERWQIDVISEVFAGILEFGAGLHAGALTLIVGNSLGTLAYDKRKQLGSVAVAASLAFGLGGRDAAKSIADDWAAKLKQNRPESQ